MIDLYKANGNKVELVEENQLKERILKPVLDSEQYNVRHIEGHYNTTKTTGNQNKEIEKFFLKLANNEYNTTFYIHFKNDASSLLIGYIYKGGKYGAMLSMNFSTIVHYKLWDGNLTSNTL